MQHIIELAEQLALALRESEEYTAMRACEQKAAADPVTTEMVGRYAQKRNELEVATSAETPDYAAVAALGKELEELDAALDALPAVADMQKAREGFTSLMNAVNGRIQYVLTGEVPGGCGGSCAGCSGCH